MAGSFGGPPGKSTRESSGKAIGQRARVVARDAPSFRQLLVQLAIEIVSEADDSAFTLVEREGRLELRPPGEADRPGIQADFPPVRIQGRGGRNPLVRAFGKEPGPIFDLTAGLGADAYRLARAGHRVLACERHPAVYALLATGWARDCELGRIDRDLAKRLIFLQKEGVDMLDRIDSSRCGVYLDPMYPSPRRIRSLPKRDLQVLRQLLGDSEDAAELTERARSRSARVVVKRPHRAPPLLPDVSFEVSTKLVRFDVYLDPDLMKGGCS